MAKSVSITFLKQDSSDKEGTLYIRTTEDRLSKRKSLGIKIRESEWEKYFNQKTQLFKSDKRFALAESINNTIKSKLKELHKNDNDLAYLPDEKKSFTKYWHKYIQTFGNYGSQIKHEVVYAKLNKFLIANNKTGLLFIEITPTLVRELKYYFTKSKDPKILSSNTVNHYLKIIKSVINRAAKDGDYIYTRDPFASLDFTKQTTTKSVLSADELFHILKIMFFDGDDLIQTRDMFIFQVFANGMRVSDLMLLRWNNFKSRRLEYKMFKTSHSISIPVNANLAGILHECLKSTESHDALYKIFKQPITDIQGNIEMVSMMEIEDRIKRLAFHELEVNDNKREEFEANVVKNISAKYKNYYYQKKHEDAITKLIDARELLLKRVDDIYIDSIFSQIRIKKEGNMNDFVFPILKNADFSNIDAKNDFSKITLEQYKTLKHTTIVYNRKLKKLQKATTITTKLTSHVARHSYTNLLLTMKDVNLYDISQSLGHSSITITQNYISNGFNIAKTDYLNNELSQKYRRR